MGATGTNKMVPKSKFVLFYFFYSGVFV